MKNGDDKRLTATERKRIGELLETAPLAEVAAKLSVAPQTLRAIAGGLEGRRGTISLVRQKLAELNQ